MQITSKSGNKHTVYPCRNGCGKVTLKKGSRCLECYKTEQSAKKQANKQMARKHYPSDNPEYRRNNRKQKLYYCKNNCGNMVCNPSSLCITCYNKALHRAGEKRQAENNKRQADTEARIKKHCQNATVSICDKSPNKMHWEIINTETNMGVCKYCGRVRDYNKLQREFKEKLFGLKKY
jgi:hypothetical protein